MGHFSRYRRIRFSETDYAGIMFYPRYIEALNDAIEDWFRDVAERSFDSLMDNYNLATPLISIQTDFLKPNRLGEEIEIAVRVEHIGKSSIRFLVEAVCDDEVRARSTLTHVCVKRDISESSPWPDDVRAQLLKGMN